MNVLIFVLHSLFIKFANMIFFQTQKSCLPRGPCLPYQSLTRQTEIECIICVLSSTLYVAASSHNYYFLFGRIIALSIIHGGPGPSCFSWTLYNQLVKKPHTYSINLLKYSPIYDQISKVCFYTT